MSTTMHERPGVYSSYDTSTVVTAGTTPKVVGAAAKAAKGETGKAVSLTSYAAGVEAFGEGAMSSLLRLLFANGASTVMAVRVDNAGGTAEYQAAFDALTAQESVQVLVCDSADVQVHQALREAVETASAARKERIAVVGGQGETAVELVSHAKKLNSERMVLAGPDGSGGSGETSGVLCAAALAGAIAANRDPAAPMNGVTLAGLSGLSEEYTDNDIDLLVRGGVTPLESRAGEISPVRCVTTRTLTGSEPDATWRELTTVLIVDDVIPAIRSALRSKFVRAKNTAQNRSAIRSQVIVELEKKKAAEIITDYGDVVTSASAEDPAVCLVEFAFAVAHGLNQIYLTAHITV